MHVRTCRNSRDHFVSRFRGVTPPRRDTEKRCIGHGTVISDGKTGRGPICLVFSYRHLCPIIPNERTWSLAGSRTVGAMMVPCGSTVSFRYMEGNAHLACARAKIVERMPKPALYT